MTAWNSSTGTSLVPREEAIGLIRTKAREEGLTQAFKVYYNGREVVSPTLPVDQGGLPEMVDMSMVRCSATFDQA